MERAVRLNKFLAERLGWSRREADQRITAGQILVNQTPGSIGQKVAPEDVVTVEGKQVRWSAKYIYVELNKPVGYVCSRLGQGAPTVYALLPEKYQSLKTVGRLDQDSSGLILLTNDGDFNHRMTHPKFAKTKIYEVTLDHDLAPLHQQIISDYGVEIGDGISKFILMPMQENDRRNFFVSMNEGRNRQIRRTFAALGYRVIRLNRIQFGSFALDTLRAGEWKEIYP